MVELVKGVGDHVFGTTRPSVAGGFALSTQPVRDTHYREPPPPTGEAPFRLDLKDVLSPAAYASIVEQKRMTFHLNGDIGGIGFATPQELVAAGMESDMAITDGTPAGTPAFLYITGDCVYFNGEDAKYYEQFYAPYKFYNAPIFAVPGNHDGENLPTDNSLAGFVRNFCAPTPEKLPEAGDTTRTTMVQPNVYWTLLTPVANIVGIYSNVPEGGDIRPPQTDWLTEELRTLPTDLPLIVALHHPIYSADDHHSGSLTMKAALETAAAATGRHPDMVLAGHVHDYQRLTKQRPDATQIPYLVTGAGGYPNLHTIRHVNGERMIPPVTFEDNDNDPVTLEAYSDDHHGFLRVELTPTTFTGRYYEVPRPQDPYTKGNQLKDYFEYNFTTHKYNPNTLTAKPTKP